MNKRFLTCCVHSIDRFICLTNNTFLFFHEIGHFRERGSFKGWAHGLILIYLFRSFIWDLRLSFTQFWVLIALFLLIHYRSFLYIVEIKSFRQSLTIRDRSRKWVYDFYEIVKSEKLKFRNSYFSFFFYFVGFKKIIHFVGIKWSLNCLYGILETFWCFFTFILLIQILKIRIYKILLLKRVFICLYVPSFFITWNSVLWDIEWVPYA